MASIPSTHWGALTTLVLPPGHVAYFFSDLHLSDAHPSLTQAFTSTLARLVKHACALPSGASGVHIILLGDIFEVWVGDDHHSATRSAVSQALKQAHHAGAKLFFMAGNRDFLIGPDYCQETGLSQLADPCILSLNTPSGPLQLMLSHGDSLCTDDTAYQAFRQQSRNPAWQKALLAKPLQERLQLAQTIRQESTQHKQHTAASIMDTNPEAVAQCFAPPYSVHALVHGHTHRSAVHHYQWSTPPKHNRTLIHSHTQPFKAEQEHTHKYTQPHNQLHGELHTHTPLRIVLPDWHITSQPTKSQTNIHGGWLMLQSSGQWQLCQVEPRE